MGVTSFWQQNVLKELNYKYSGYQNYEYIKKILYWNSHPPILNVSRSEYKFLSNSNQTNDVKSNRIFYLFTLRILRRH